ncbi:structure-specific endonuclease subunit SLX4 [Arapaima gigas]
MDDSEDFTELCAKLLKRVRRREAGEKKAERQPPNQANKRVAQKWPKNDVNPSSKASKSQASYRLQSNGTRGLEGASEEAVLVAKATPQSTVSQPIMKQQPLGVVEKVVSRMQRFKRVSPQKLKPNQVGLHADALLPPQEQDPKVTPPTDPEGDEAMALRLQQELDQEVWGEPVDLEEGGLFFCQICQRDLSAMSPQCRAQHVNRCLDKSEDSAPPSLAPPQIPECPICGKGFKSEKSRATHLKRCPADMGVAPVVLMEALQRQVAEAMASGDSSTGQLKGSAEPSRLATKKPRKKPPALDEDTMVAMALSRSMLEQEKEKQKQQEAQQVAAQTASSLPLGWKPDPGKRRRKKGAPPALPPLLLTQNPQDVLHQLQDRIAALLLQTQPNRPPTPRLPASTLPLWTGVAPLWQKSTLQDGGPVSILDFYTEELKPTIEPWVPPSAVLKLDPEGCTHALPTMPAETPRSAGDASSPLGERPNPVPSPVPTLSVGSQALCDLMDLAEEGMTLTQYGGVSRPLPGEHNAAHMHAHTQTHMLINAPLCRLATDLASMVNNPQLSDVQLQVDSGDIFFIHSFMLYARCPLLAQMVHNSGFGVQEKGMPCAQRVLLGEVPSEAVLALLQYLYTGHCPLRPALLTQVQELALRFDLEELQELCKKHAGDRVPEPWGKIQEPGQNTEEEEPHNEEQSFMVLLRSMWEEEEAAEEEQEEVPEENRRGVAMSPLLGDTEPGEEKVDEDELEEIYEFAATQRKLGSGRNSGQEEKRDRVNSYTGIEEGEGRAQRGNSEYMADELKEASQQGISCHSHRDGFPDGHAAETSTCQMTDVGMEQAVPVKDFYTEQTRAPCGVAPVGSMRSDSVHSPDAGLNKSYDHLFSESWGNCEEPCPSQPPCCSPSASLTAGPKEVEQPDVEGIFTPASGEDWRCKSSIDRVAVIGNPFVSSLSITGISPASVEDKDPDNLERGSSLTGDTQVCQTGPGSKDKCVSGKATESDCRRVSRPVTPELIVISDSGDEMDFSTGNMEAEPSGLSNQQPQVSHRVADGTCQRLEAIVTVSPKQVSQAVKVAKKVNPEVLASHSDPLAGSSISPQINSSAEISWLIPATPMQPQKAARTGSTQTYSSMCRTKLFSTSLGNKSRSSSSSLTPPSIPHTSVNLKPTNIQPSGLSKGEGSLSKSSNMAALNSCLVADPGRPEESPATPTIPSFQLASCRLTSSQPRNFILDDTDCNGISPNAASTPLHPSVSEHLGANQHTLPHSSSSNLGTSHKSPGCRLVGTRIPSREPSSEPQQGDNPESTRSRSDALLTSSPQHKGSVVGESPDKYRSFTRQNHTENSDTGKFSGSRGKVVESSLSQQSFCAAEEPPMPFDDSWIQRAHFSLQLDSNVGVSPPEQSQLREREERSSLTPTAAIRITPQNVHEPHASMLDSKIWDDWEEEEALDIPLSKRVCPAAPSQRVTQLKTPVASRRKSLPLLEPITPMPGFSDMETPELKNRLKKFGVRPLPKRQMVLKLKEIHQYTHQLLSSDSEGEGLVLRTQEPHTALHKPSPMPPTTLPSKEPVGAEVKVWSKAVCVRQGKSGERDGDEQPLSTSQGSTTSSTAASEDSDRSNPELCPMSDDNSDSDEVTASQAVSRDAAKLQAVWHFLQSDLELYSWILQYRPLVLADLQARLKVAGIRIGAAKLLDFLDSQCITFTTANPAKATASRGRVPGRGRGHRRKGTAKSLA